ncbi:MAG: Rrf2 family transcriptional regulator [Fusobacteriaceae bacterium]|jgi:Rrf2 family protein|nr:Rrf2 family transcriptional regulator [Fusobacteriaceae bacterium]MBP6466810.1 Rrf2 family transcriptional regulator [Fusobacteriaceae bacterium]MBP9595723.1 Rrf2 family transcriptional regulator [Fusobacteriaceae bacterium]MBU9917004.1 Rrf2 family transcriptional regulator [Fusobacteriaceae bacterium]
MKISTKTRYGLRALIHIAEETANDEDKLVRIKEISENQKLSVQYLEQILFKLKKSGIIVGKRGPNGGYRLNKEPKDISILEIFNILETDIKVVMCDKHNKNCVRTDCRTLYLWEKLDTALSKILKETTLAELMLNGAIV